MRTRIQMRQVLQTTLLPTPLILKFSLLRPVPTRKSIPITLVSRWNHRPGLENKTLKIEIWLNQKLSNLFTIRIELAKARMNSSWLNKTNNNLILTLSKTQTCPFPRMRWTKLPWLRTIQGTLVKDRINKFRLMRQAIKRMTKASRKILKGNKTVDNFQLNNKKQLKRV